MKNYLLTAFLLFSIILNAQKPENSRLWKISGKGIKTASYLYGTNHVECNPEFSPKALKALEASSMVIFESNDNISQDELQKYLLQLVVMDKTIQSNLSDAEFKKLDEKTTDLLQIPAANLNNLKPWLVSLMLSFTNKCKVSGTETAIKKIIADKKITTASLEKTDVLNDFILLMDKVSYEEQIAGLKAEIAKTEKTEAVEERDINKLANSVYDNKSAFGKEFAEVLLIKRNKAWLPTIEKNIIQKSNFIAVGAAHLGGEHGLITLLRKKGYTVEAVK